MLAMWCAEAARLAIAVHDEIAYKIRELYTSKVSNYYEFYRHQEEGIQVRTLRARMDPKKREDHADSLPQVQVSLLVAAKTEKVNNIREGRERGILSKG